MSHSWLNPSTWDRETVWPSAFRASVFGVRSSDSLFVVLWFEAKTRCSKPEELSHTHTGLIPITRRHLYDCDRLQLYARKIINLFKLSNIKSLGSFKGSTQPKGNQISRLGAIFGREKRLWRIRQTFHDRKVSAKIWEHSARWAERRRSYGVSISLKFIE